LFNENARTVSRGTQTLLQVLEEWDRGSHPKHAITWRVPNGRSRPPQR
jgi:hypothetical protein